MRDPLTWSFPLPGRLFGVTIRIHVLFLIVIIALPMRVAFQKDSPPGLWLEACVLMGLLFVSVLLHEFGHCFGARAVDGDATEVLLWPLGGLAAVEVPHTPRAHFITTAAGPAVNLLLGVAACLALACWSVAPSFKPWADPYFPVVYHWSDGCYYGTKDGRGVLYKFTAFKDKEKDGAWVSYDPQSPEKYQSLPKVNVHPDDVATLVDKGKVDGYVLVMDKDKKKDQVETKSEQIKVKAEDLPSGGWVALFSRFFWVNWFLFLLNLVPAFPLDGGRLLQSVLWWRSDYRQGTLFAIGTGFLMMFVCILLAIITLEPLILGLAWFIYVACRRQWILLETGGEESLFGYDFSEGYTSLERDQPVPPRRRKSWLARWLQSRAEKRMRKEQEQREAEERRMDELLEKVQRVGLQGLTDEERRFLTRVSARYRNRQE
jgi:Zn-dependent protease